MNTKILLTSLFVLCLLLNEKAWSIPTRITGKAPEYANHSIELNSFHDFISEEKIKLAVLKFNADGAFSVEIDLNEISLCFADFDGYHGMIYLEPGKSYEILFPPKRQLTESQKRNPFVKPEPVWFGILNPDKTELNYQIQQFEQAYTNYENKYFDQIFISRTRSLVDSVKLRLDQEFPATKSTFFEAHKKFRKANLEFALHQGKGVGFMETYFNTTEPVVNLAAYTNLFNQIFLNYFNVLVSNRHLAEVDKLINTSALAQLDEYFQKQLSFNKELAHWVLLKSMKDAYYSKQFPKASILKMLDQVKNLGWSPVEQKTAQLIRAKLTWLSSGTIPPSLALKNINGQNINLADYRNSYVYLHFTDPKNTICQQHLEALKAIAARHKEKLVIINIIPKNQAFTNSSNWAGIFAKTGTNLEETYKIKTFPTSFLIGKDGKLLLSPAPNPIDGLDRQLGQLFKSDYIRELQKNNQKTK